jgi:hypothetical protein
MATMNSIDELWSKISSQSTAAGTFRLVDDSHPLDLFAGVDLEGRRVLMLVTEHAPQELPAAGVIEVSLTQRSDGKFSLVFRLGRPEFHELFGRLCQDLVETSRASDRQNGTERLLLRLSRWRKLLEPGPSQGLTDQQLRGLFGELWFLKMVAMPLVGNLSAVNSWNGPLGSPQDFQLGNSLVEIKSILPGAHKVSISSAEQLEHGDTPLQLAVVIIDTSKGMSAIELIAQLREELEETPGAAAEFDLRLAEVGYTDRAEYSQLQFTVQSIRYYPVTETFPRIGISGLPAGISRVTYDLDLLQCGAFRSEYIYAAG